MDGALVTPLPGPPKEQHTKSPLCFGLRDRLLENKRHEKLKPPKLSSFDLLGRQFARGVSLFCCMFGIHKSTLSHALPLVLAEASCLDTVALQQ